MTKSQIGEVESGPEKARETRSRVGLWFSFLFVLLCPVLHFVIHLVRESPEIVIKWYKQYPFVIVASIAIRKISHYRFECAINHQVNLALQNGVKHGIVKLGKRDYKAKQRVSSLRIRRNIRLIEQHADQFEQVICLLDCLLIVRSIELNWPAFCSHFSHPKEFIQVFSIIFISLLVWLLLCSMHVLAT